MRDERDREMIRETPPEELLEQLPFIDVPFDHLGDLTALGAVSSDGGSHETAS